MRGNKISCYIILASSYKNFFLKFYKSFETAFKYWEGRNKLITDVLYQFFNKYKLKRFLSEYFTVWKFIIDIIKYFLEFVIIHVVSDKEFSFRYHSQVSVVDTTRAILAQRNEVMGALVIQKYNLGDSVV